MKRLKWLAAGLALAITVPLAAWGNAEETREVDAAAAFARLKALEGTWEAPAAGGHKARSSFELTAGGTVLLERYENPAMPGGGRMATAYFIQDGALVLTHYCIARNHPMMRAGQFDAATGRPHAAGDVSPRLAGPVHHVVGVLREGRARDDRNRNLH
jgi:hypothetical protein